MSDKFRFIVGERVVFYSARWGRVTGKISPLLVEALDAPTIVPLSTLLCVQGDDGEKYAAHPGQLRRLIRKRTWK